MPVATLEAAQANGGTNSPIVNGTTLKEQPLESFATGNVNRVPAILGVNRDEDLTGTAETPAAYTALVNSQNSAPAMCAPRVISRGMGMDMGTSAVMARGRGRSGQGGWGQSRRISWGRA